MRIEAKPQTEVTAPEVADELPRGRCRNGSEAVGVLQLTSSLTRTSVKEAAGRERPLWVRRPGTLDSRGLRVSAARVREAH